MVVQEMVLLGSVVALLVLVLVRALLQAAELVRVEALVLALEQELALVQQELVQARSAMVLAQAREWEFHRESGKAREME
jgi:hypothetical protein